MDTADLNEASHEHDESDPHQQHCPPMSLGRKMKNRLNAINTETPRDNCSDHAVDTYHNPLCDVLVELWVEDGLL